MAKRNSKVSSQLFARIKDEIPSSETLALMAIERKLGQRNEVETYIRENFSALITELLDDVYALYRECETHSASYIIRKEIEDQLKPDDGKEKVLLLLESSFGALDRFFLSLSQSRKSRAGSAFQVVMSALLAKLNYPFESQPVLADSKPDYVLPSVAWYKHNATDCIILTLKRTLRERWRQVPTEGNSGSTFFLATIDGDLPENELHKMGQLNVRLVVSKQLKAERYDSFPSVISFEYFLEYFLDPAMKRWKVDGAIL